MDLHLDGKNALITGGSKGIGRAAAEILASEGCNLVLVARTQKDLDAAKSALLAKFNTRVETVAADLADSRNVDRLANQFPDIDILVNNAGATWGAPAEDHPLEAWDKLVSVNLTGVFVLTQIIGKQSMIPARWGRIINVASIAGLMGQDPRIVRTIAYNATKGGLVNFTRALAAEWGSHGITVNAICPGFFPSKMTKATLDTTGELVRDWTPTKRLGNDEDLKGLAVLLASEASRHITGQAIAVDGGATVI